ncbi:hypothetical protein B9Z65_2066 [Elsinoe australis]|uniref:Uncharacterized protein n=1 Tax=Elsinoe australis TaxID=40998 RepID=A0A2P7YMX9_9PEZI|nr:hypothetical protein B9Z65_2066 [Elsinoe australis]
MHVQYCSYTCQQFDKWSHGPECTRARQRRTLKLVCSKLQALLLKTRRWTFPHQIGEVRRVGSELRAETSPALAPRSGQEFTFDLAPRVWQNTTPADRAAIWTAHWDAQCIAIVHGLFYPIFAALTGTTGAAIRAVTIQAHRVHMSTRIEQSVTNGLQQGHSVYNSNADTLLTLLHIKLSSEEEFAIDFTGAQFGNFHTVMPWYTIEQHATFPDPSVNVNLDQILHFDEMLVKRGYTTQMLRNIAFWNDYTQLFIDTMRARMRTWWQARPLDDQILVGGRSGGRLQAHLDDLEVRVENQITHRIGQLAGFATRYLRDPAWYRADERLAVDAQLGNYQHINIVNESRASEPWDRNP